MSYQHPTFDRYRLQTMGWLEEEKCDGQLYHPLLDIELFVLPRTFNLELLNAYLTSIHALALNFHFNLILHPSSCTLLQVSKTPRFFFLFASYIILYFLWKSDRPSGVHGIRRFTQTEERAMHSPWPHTTCRVRNKKPLKSRCGHNNQSRWSNCRPPRETSFFAHPSVRRSHTDGAPSPGIALSSPPVAPSASSSLQGKRKCLLNG